MTLLMLIVTYGSVLHLKHSGDVRVVVSLPCLIMFCSPWNLHINWNIMVTFHSYIASLLYMMLNIIKFSCILTFNRWTKEEAVHCYRPHWWPQNDLSGWANSRSWCLLPQEAVDPLEEQEARQGVCCSYKNRNYKRAERMYEGRVEG